MRYCSHCGAELGDNDIFCGKCGAQVDYANPSNEVLATASRELTPTGLQTAAKVFMILSTIFMGFFIIPLIWCIPMTFSYCNKIKRGEKVGTGFAICALLFVNVLAGIFMLVDNN